MSIFSKHGYDHQMVTRNPLQESRNQETEKKDFDHKERKEQKTENNNKRLWPKSYRRKKNLRKRRKLLDIAVQTTQRMQKVSKSGVKPARQNSPLSPPRLRGQ
jgi:hypothetical protein